MANPSRIFKKYLIFPLILTGCLILAILTLASLLIWTMLAYYGQLDPASAGGWASGLYLLLIFLSCWLMTWLIRGGTVFPAVVLSLLAAVATFFLSQAELSFAPALLKALFSLFAGVLGFTLSKLLVTLRRKAKKAETPGK
ncbi:MAG: hypothetical protein IJP07_01300 [Firmicutes bacterium]|nr:hypothetical protein [Bacillota bacterium]